MSRRPLEKTVADRRRRAERRRHLRFFEAVLLVVLTAALPFLFYHQARLPVFALSTIGVIGNERVPAAAIVSASGLKLGEPLIFIHARTVEERLLERQHWLATVSLAKRFPASLQIRVQEKAPVARFSLFGRSVVLDEEGKTLGPSMSADAGLPVISVRDVTAAYSTGRPLRRTAAVAIRCYCLLPLTIRRRIVSIDAPSVASISFRLRGGTRVVYGSAEMAQMKNVILRKFLSEMDDSGRSFANIDVRVPSRPAVRKGGAP